MGVNLLRLRKGRMVDGSETLMDRAELAWLIMVAVAAAFVVVWMGYLLAPIVGLP